MQLELELVLERELPQKPPLKKEKDLIVIYDDEKKNILEDNVIFQF